MLQSADSTEVGHAAIAKFVKHVMPLLGLMYLIAYIDRQNIGFAKLQMAGDLGLSESAYGLGASLFFIGYFLFEVPSNLFLARVGARRWFARIMVSWGIVTTLLGYTNGTAMFYVLRFLLGAMEAGFFPGVLYLLTIWVPFGHRARMVGWFMIASAVANAVGAPICGMLLDLDGALGLRGWQWVFLATGAPAIVMTAIVLLVLPNGPETAPWLSQDQRDWLARTLRAEREGGGLVDHGNPFAALLDKRVLMLAGVYVSLPLAAYGLGYWLPTVVKGFGVSNLTNGFLNIIPWVATAVALWWVPRHAARTNAQGNALTWHVVGPALVGATGLALSVILPGNAVKFACLCVAAAGTFSAQPVFWSMPATFLRGATAAAGIAAINSVGNLGGFVAQNMVPFIRDQTKSDLVPMLFLSACLAIGAGAMFVVLSALRRDAAKRGATTTRPRAA